ncbi:Urease accessory protein UreH [Bienertia sinuspersici]
MERLMSSSSSLPSQLHHLKPYPYVPQHPHPHSHGRAKFGSSLLPPITAPVSSSRFNSLSLKLHPIHLRPSSFSINSSFNPSLSNGSSPEPQITLSTVQKAAKIILFSALAMTLINPARTLPALASTTGGTAVAKGFFRTEILTSAWTGFFAGCLHTLSGPDHLAALAPLSIGRSKMESAAVGALWGCGHDAGQLIFGLLFLLLKDRLHIKVIRTWGTRVVGLTLLVIGAMGIKEASEVPAPCVALENGECDVSVYENVETPTVVKKKRLVLQHLPQVSCMGFSPMP